MFTSFKTTATKVLLDPQNCIPLSPKKGERFDLILSPALYWVQRVKLPIANLRGVKKLLPSLFEDFLPEGHYSYTAQKDGNEFLIFAYEDKQILSLVQQCNLQPSQINSVTFAQNALREFHFPLKLNDTQLLTLQDGIVVVIPKEWEEQANSLDLLRAKTSQHPITLQQFGHIVDSKSLYKIIALLVALGVVLGIELFVTHQKISQVQAQEQALFTQYHLKPTMMQNKAILRSYTALYTHQKKLRETIDIFLALRLNKTQHLSLLEYNDTHFAMSITDVDAASRKKIETSLQAKGLKITTTLKNKTMRVEVEL